MTGKSLKYLCVLLNGKISSWYFDLMATSSGVGTNMWKKYKIELLPIPSITPSNEPIVKQIEALVDKILEAKKQSTAADTKHLEDQIDIMVYKLYELIYEEVKVIDPAFALSREEYELKTSKKSFKVF